MPPPNLDVGRYAVFIWPAYAISALTLAGLTLDSLLRAARWRRAAEDAPGAHGAREGATPPPRP